MYIADQAAQDSKNMTLGLGRMKAMAKTKTNNNRQQKQINQGPSGAEKVQRARSSKRTLHPTAPTTTDSTAPALRCSGGVPHAWTFNATGWEAGTEGRDYYCCGLLRNTNVSYVVPQLYPHANNSVYLKPLHQTFAVTLLPKP